ncbi:hypothetical protein WS79_10865 [Burkholderia territorii]|nr:hypothetical protein WS79_10865 [Burkholderia territorii]
MLQDIENIEPPDDIKQQLGNSTLQQYLESDGAWRLNNASKRALEIIIQSPNLNKVFLDAHWDVHTITKPDIDLVIGDRPLLLEGRMTGLYLFAIPISPTQLFLASNNRMAISHIIGDEQSELVCTINRESIAVADKYVYSTDDRQAALVERYLRKPDGPDDQHIVSGLRKALNEDRSTP